MQQQRRRSNQDGFTLIEIMVVILILGLLATIVVQSLRGATDKANGSRHRLTLRKSRPALDRYYLDAGSYPTSDQGLQSLVAAPTGGNGAPNNYETGGYLQSIPRDPWGNAIPTTR